jgi:hypothetical protein
MNRNILAAISVLCLTLFVCTSSPSPQSVFLIVIDGARYSETFGAEDKYIPHMWNTLRPQGTIYSHFYNDGTTETNSGHASLATGTWQHLVNDGSEYPNQPTVFEYYRKYTSAPESTCFVIAGKKKLHILAHSSDANYRASFRTSASFDDLDTWEQVLEVIDRYHPRLVVVGFPEVDIKGHDGDWNGYIRALRQVDSLIAVLWEKIQSDPVYKNTTTMFVTNDHGRHTDVTQGFKDHGDSCEGCRHIMLLAVGPDFAPNTVVPDTTFQIDIAPTIGAILGFPTPQAQSKCLLPQLVGAQMR